jgi:diphthamide biosynthesis protein 2
MEQLWEDVHEIGETVAYIEKTGFSVVALQFPDALLAEAPRIVAALKCRLKTTSFYVLADTPYGSCCVDEVAAEHVQAQLVVHYGKTCFSRTSRIPVFYVFGKSSIDIPHLVKRFESVFTPQQRVILLCEESYLHALRSIISCLMQNGSCEVEPITASAPRVYEPQHEVPRTSSVPPAEGFFCLGLRIFPYSLDELRQHPVFYVGAEGGFLTRILYSFNSSMVFSYNPLQPGMIRQESLQSNKALMRRYFLVQKAREAQVIGIVAGTLGAAGYLSTLSQLRQEVEAAGKKVFTYVVGKLNVAKLANFIEVDVFVMLACPENTLVDSQEYFRPIITPYELQVALGGGKDFFGEYTLDFRTITFEGHEDESEPSLSLVTGKLVSRDPVAVSRTIQHASLGTPAWSAASERLHNRNYVGLVTGETSAPGVLASRGRSGIPKGYDHEPPVSIL